MNAQTSIDITPVRMSNTHPVVPSVLSPGVSVEFPDILKWVAEYSMVYMCNTSLG